MASFQDGAGRSSPTADVSRAVDNEEVILDEDGDDFAIQDDTTYRQMPPTFQASQEHFSLEDLEDKVMRSVSMATPTKYHPRSVSLLGSQQAPSFSVGQQFSMPKFATKPGAREMGLKASMFASAHEANATSHGGIPEPPKLPPYPYFLDRNSFDLNCSHVPAPQLHKDLLHIFTETHVDYIWKPEKWKFVCKAYPSDEVVDFRTRLYLRPSGDTYALEFQRRSGCRISYHSLLQRIKSGLRLSRNPVPTIRPSGKGNPQSPLTKRGISAIVGMIKSHYLDEQYEGLKLLCAIVQKSHKGLLLLDTNAIVSVLACLQNASDHEVRRLSGKILCEFVQGFDLVAAKEAGNLASDKDGLLLDIVDAAVDLLRCDDPSTEKSSLSHPKPKYPDLSRKEVRRTGAALLCVLVKWGDARKRLEANGGHKALHSIIQAEKSDQRLKNFAQDCWLCIQSM